MEFGATCPGGWPWRGERPFDALPVPGTGADDLSRPRFEYEYLPNAVARKDMLANEQSHGERLTATRMMVPTDGGTATVLGLLVIGVRPRDYIPGAYIRFLRIAGRNLLDPIIDETEFDGTVSDILTRLDDKLRVHNLRRIEFVHSDTERRSELYPLGALQHLVRNAVMHRDYETTNIPTLMTWYDDRIEIQSPGGPFGIATMETFARPGITDYRNPNLAQAMQVQGFAKGFGVGIPTAQRLLREKGHPELELTIEPTHLLTTVRAVP